MEDESLSSCGFLRHVFNTVGSLAEFMILDSNTVKSILTENSPLLFQFTMSVTAGESPATLRPQLYLAGSLTNEFETFGSSY